MKNKCIVGTLLALALWPHGLARPACAAGSGSVASTPDPVVHLSREQMASFTAALAALSAQAHVAFVAEGQPLHPNQGQAGGGPAPDPRGVPLSKLVDAVAAAYDYRAERFGSVYRLKKRYSDVSDLPDVTLAECALDAEDAEKMLDAFAPVIGEGKPLITPDIRLPMDQIKAAQSETGVPVSVLSSDQQQSLQGFLMHSEHHTPKPIIQTGIGYLKQVAQGDPRLCRRDLSALIKSVSGVEGISVFGFEESSISEVQDGQRQPTFNILSNPGGGSGGGFTNGAGRGLMLPVDSNDRLTQRFHDASDPLPTPPPPTPAVGTPLGQIVAALVPRVHGGPPLAVEDCLAPKRAIVVGDQYATPMQILEALAAVYGLRVRPEDPYALRTPAQGAARVVLSRPRPDVPADVTGLQAAIQQALPDAMVRALNAHRNDLHAAAVRELRTVAEPKIKASPDGRVALSSLTDRERPAFAVAIANDLMEGFGSLSVGDNPYITHFNEITLVGQTYGPQGGRYGLFVRMKTSNGSGTMTSLYGPVGSLDAPAQ